MSVNKTERGFSTSDPIASEYGGTIKVTESSLATRARVWIFCKSPSDVNSYAINGEKYDGKWEDASALLSLEDAEKFANNILDVVKSHRMYEYAEV